MIYTWIMGVVWLIYAILILVLGADDLFFAMGLILAGVWFAAAEIIREVNRERPGTRG